MQKLLEQFVPAADEVWRLQHRDGAECDLFRTIAEQGHYAGRTEPTDTRQGIYATAPGGRLLASCNTKSADRVIDMLEEALARWETLPETERYLAGGADDDDPLTRRWERLYPHDGMVLLVTSRDLPREVSGPALTGRPSRDGGDEQRGRGGRRGRGWKRHAWNHDYAWFRKPELMEFVPRRREAGAMAIVPDNLVRRLARLHLVDNVRGQTSQFKPGDVADAEMFSRLVEVRGNELRLELDGHVRMVRAAPPVPEDLPEDRRRWDPDLLERGVDVQLLGRATFDTATGRFTTFEVMAVGARWGATRYNGRERDAGRHGIGFALTLADDDPPVAPAFVWEYGWR